MQRIIDIKDWPHSLDKPCLFAMGELFDTELDHFSLSKELQGRRIVVSRSPQIAKYVLQSKHQDFIKGTGLDRVRILLGQGLFSSEGDFWHRQRRLIQGAFHPNFLGKVLTYMPKAHKRVQKICLRENKIIDMRNITSQIALWNILYFIFGELIEQFDDSDGHNPFDLVHNQTNRDLNFALSLRALKKQILLMAQQARAADGEPKSFLDYLVKTCYRSTNEYISDKALIDEVITMIIAGHETTAATMAWVWVLLSQHDSCMQKVQAELKGAYFDIDIMQIMHAYPYTKAVIFESLRLYPPGWMYTRRAKTAQDCGDFQLEAGDEVWLPSYYLHRHEKYWFDAEKFIPQRFLNEQSHDKYAYLPFSLGPRRCIGEQLAIVEIIYHIAYLLSQYKLTFIPPKEIKLDAEINLRASTPLNFMFKKLELEEVEI